MILNIMSKTLVLDGEKLTIKDIYSFVNDPQWKVEIALSAIDKVKQARDFLEEHRRDKVIYGVNTGFGPMSSYVIGDDEVNSLQINLIFSHAAGAGDPIDDRYVLAAMLVRLNTMLRGHSGVTVELIERLALYINQRIIPLVPEHGAVGTSGDLVQLAHITLALIGHGRVSYQRQIQPMEQVAKQLGIKPYILKAKEGLALINGTSVMGGISAVLGVEAMNILANEIKMGAWALELVGAFNDSIAEELHRLRPHRGQMDVAKALRTILASSKLLRDRQILDKNHHVGNGVQKIAETVQEVYSFRCLAQILGPIQEIIENARRVVEIEINSVTDNPIIDWQNKRFLHGGNFHGDYIAVIVDQLKIGLVKLGLLAERRINFFLNQKINGVFPPFLNLGKPGLTLGLQGLQFVATSTAAQNQTLAFPQYVHSISTNGDNQDVVSMGTDAALLCARVISNTYIIQAIEAITLAQGTDFLKLGRKLAELNQSFFDDVRAVSPILIEDRILADDVGAVMNLLKQYAVTGH